VKDAAYTTPLAAIGGDGTYTWSIDGTLPTGLTLDGATGVISGTPTVLGTNFLTVTVTDGTTATATRALSIDVNRPLAVSTISLPDGADGVDYGKIPLEAIGGDGDYFWEITIGALPLGLKADTLGVITGKPTAAAVSKTFTVEVEDGDDLTAIKELTITIP